MRWAVHVARMAKGRDVYRVLVGRPEGKGPLGRPITKIWIDGPNWIRLAQDRAQWRGFVGTVMNLRFP